MQQERGEIPGAKKCRFQRPMHIPSRIGRGSWLAPLSGRLEPGRATSRGEKEPSCREGQPGEREKDGRERRRRTTRMRHQWRLRSRAARLGPTTDPAGPQPQPTCCCSTGARPRATRAHAGAGRGVAPGEASIRGGPPLESRAGANRGALHHRRR
jgi:hypothetical protein